MELGIVSDIDAGERFTGQITMVRAWSMFRAMGWFLSTHCSTRILW